MLPCTGCIVHMGVSSIWERQLAATHGEKGKQLTQPGTAPQLREAISHLGLPALFHTAYWRATWKHQAGRREGTVSHSQAHNLLTPKPFYGL